MFASEQDQIERMKFTFPSKTDKIHAKYTNDSLQNTEHQKMKDGNS